MSIIGKNYIGFSQSADNSTTFQSYVPVNDTYLPEKFYPATPEEVDRTMQLAEKAFDEYAALPASRRADFLVAVAEEIMAMGGELLERAHQETGLPMGRLQGERGRTVNQLTQFADLIREGSWVEARIDTALPDRSPAPKPDLRKMLIPIGPIVVFGSSNFPFAYSIAGVDTGPALAAGNPVILKAHPAHPGVSDLTAQAIVKAAKRTDMPDGVFSMLYDDGYEVGTALVQHPHTKAVGFTGSLKGGMALYKMAQERDEPIPVFAEMGSVNPVVILPEALAEKADALAKMLAGSVTLGAGQFCTNPGLVFTVNSPAVHTFVREYGEEVAKVTSMTMLTEGIRKNYYKLRDAVMAESGVEKVAASEVKAEGENQSQAAIAQVSGQDFMANPKLHEEVFGPFSLLVVCQDLDELNHALKHVPGQLTTTLMAADGEAEKHPKLMRLLARRAGRFIMNGVPTGVEVCAAQHHGGPFPSTTDSRFTSVGRDAILRFVRPLSFQDWPNSLLPDELKDGNPLSIWRLVNDKWRQDKN